MSTQTEATARAATLASYCGDLVLGGERAQSRALRELFAKGGLWGLCESAAAGEAPDRLVQAAADLQLAAAAPCFGATSAALSRAARLVAAAEVAARARDVAQCEPVRLLEAAWRAGGGTGGPPAGLEMTGEWGRGSGVTRAVRAFEIIAAAALPPDHLAPARAAALLLLPNGPIGYALYRVPILVKLGEETGVVVRLNLRRVPHACRGFLPAPWMSLQTGLDWDEALDDVWQTVQAGFPEEAVVWWISENHQGLSLDGQSGGAAVRIALELLRDGEPWDHACAVTARLAGNQLDQLEGVGGVAKADQSAGPKLDAAVDAGITRLILAPGDFQALDPALQASCHYRGMKLVPCGTVQEARAEVSGLAIGRRAYYQGLEALPDVRKNPWGHQAPGDLYVEPDVVKVRPPAGALEMAGGHSGQHVSPEARDAGEDVFFGGRWVLDGPELRWSIIFGQLLEGSEPFRCVILGPPGQGKTLLAGMTVRRLAQAERESLGKGNSELPVVLARLPAVLNGYPEWLRTPQALPSGDVPAAAARIANVSVRAATGREHPLAEAYLAQRLVTGPSVLFLDALDEAVGPGRDESDLVALLSEVWTWNASVVVLSRPYGYTPERLPIQPDVYRICEFQQEQAEEFVGRFFSGDSRDAREKRERALRLLHGSASVRRISQNPFLLTLFCAVSATGNIPEEIRRHELYKRALLLAVGTDGKGAERLKALEKVAWHMLCRDANSPNIDSDTLTGVLDKSWPGYTPGATLDDLSQKLRLLTHGLLTEAGAWERYVFPHRSLADFLAASYLARQVRDARESRQNGWTAPIIPYFKVAQGEPK